MGVLSLLLAGCQQAYFRALNIGVAKGTPVVFDATNQLSLDVYKPENSTGPAPIVVFFYGGSWQSGDRGFYRFVGEALARSGFVAVIPDYRKAPGNVFPDFMVDAASAVAWSRSHAREIGGDPSRLFVMGHSAGAQIAALLGADAQYLNRHQIKPRDLAGIIGLSGPYDFLPLTEDGIKQALGPPAGWPNTQPINFVDGDEPPFLLLQGDKDTRVDPGNSTRLAARLRAQGEPVLVHMVPGVGHIGMVNGFYSPRFSPALQESVDWIRQHDDQPRQDGRLSP